VELEDEVDVDVDEALAVAEALAVDVEELVPDSVKTEQIKPEPDPLLLS
jgi:hypothetical protein